MMSRGPLLVLTCAWTISGAGCAMMWPGPLDDVTYPKYSDVTTEPCDPALCPDTTQLERANTRVVVGDVVTNAQDRNVAKTLPKALQAAIEKRLSPTGIEIVARGSATKLLREVEITEQKGYRGRYEGPIVADYAIVSEINSVDINGTFLQPVVIEGTKISGPKCKYAANFGGTMRIYRIPALNVAASIALYAESSMTEPATSTSCPTASKQFQSLERQAAEDSIRLTKEGIQNFFSPEGFVVVRRRWEKKGREIFWVTGGENAGFKLGDKVQISRNVLEKNPLTGKSELHEETFGEGEVVRASETRSWIALSDVNTSTRVIQGDSVKVIYEKGFWDTVRDLPSNVASGSK